MIYPQEFVDHITNLYGLEYVDYMNDESYKDYCVRKEHFKKAKKYVRDHHSWSDAEDAVALERINGYRCGIDFADSAICDEIVELMDEYGNNEDLPEDWWRDFGDEDDIFMDLWT